MLVAAVTLVVDVGAAGAGAPTEQLKAEVDRVLAVLQDPALRGPEHREQRQAAIRAAMDVIVDFPELSRRALGAAWGTHTPTERTEFVTAFAEFVKRAYLSRIDVYNDERVVWLDEQVSGDRAVVNARIQWKDGDTMPIAFRMMQADGGRWRLYDVSMDGVSLVENYRTQFAAVLRRTSFEDLLKRLRTQGASRN